jgi:diguanylate cyclase (GGDEF)-like protein
VDNRTRNNTLVGPALGLLVALLGLTTTSGWLLQVPAMVQLRQGLLPMVFNTGLCFLLTGTALVLAHWHCRQAVLLRTLISAILVGLCGLTLAEHVLDRSLFGIDLAGVHAWYDYGNTRPGRMAPNTALGFIVAGSALFIADRVRSRRWAVAELLLTFLLMAIGLTGLVGYLLSPDLLFNWAKSARMALHTATGMILVALALWLSWSRSPWYLGEDYFREDVKVRMLSAAILVLVATTTALTGFVFQQTTAQSTMEARLTTIVQARGPWLRLVAQEVARQAELAALLADLDESLRTPSPARDRQIRHLADDLARHGWQRAVLQLPDGDVAVLGRAEAAPPFEAALDAEQRLTLVWDQTLSLRLQQPLAGGMRLLMERPAPELAAALFAVGGLGETGEVAACVSKPGGMLCLPTRLRPQPFFLANRPAGADPLAMQLALAGQRGVKKGMDYRQQAVIVAYGQLAPGLGFIAKQDAVEIYAPIRQALAVGAPLLLLLSVIGAGLMVWQLSPLVTRMRHAEAVASTAAAEMQTIVDSAGDGILTLNGEGRIVSANPAAGRLFGYDPAELRVRPMADLLPGGLDDAGGEGLRRDGTRFALEGTSNPVPLQGQALTVVTLRDISLRKELEGKLSRLAQFDALTGLPNRSLFMDRLATAALRAGRANRPLAVLFLDLDGFKAINDGFGHREGDAVLVETARRLARAVRKSDTVARLGGDEFTIILEQLSDPMADVRAVSEKIIQAMQQPFIVQGTPQQVTVSIGAALHPEGGQEPSTTALLNRADHAMYEAKRAGKNAFRITALAEPA